MLPLPFGYYDIAEESIWNSTTDFTNTTDDGRPDFLIRVLREIRGRSFRVFRNTNRLFLRVPRRM